MYTYIRKFLLVLWNIAVAVALRQFRPQGIPNEVVHSNFDSLLACSIIQLSNFYLCQQVNSYQFGFLKELGHKHIMGFKSGSTDRKPTNNR